MSNGVNSPDFDNLFNQMRQAMLEVSQQKLKEEVEKIVKNLPNTKDWRVNPTPQGVLISAPGEALLDELGDEGKSGDYSLLRGIRSVFGSIRYLPESDLKQHREILNRRRNETRRRQSLIERQLPPERQWSAKEVIKQELQRKRTFLQKNQVQDDSFYDKSQYSPLQNAVGSIVASHNLRNVIQGVQYPFVNSLRLRLQKELKEALRLVPSKLPSYKEKILLSLLKRKVALSNKNTPISPEVVNLFVNMARDTEIIREEFKRERDREQVEYQVKIKKGRDFVTNIRGSTNQFNPNMKDPYGLVKSRKGSSSTNNMNKKSKKK